MTDLIARPARSDANELATIEARMVVRFVPPLERADVYECIEQAVALFDGAPIRQYVALLVERIVADRLRAWVRASAEESPISGGQ